MKRILAALASASLLSAATRYVCPSLTCAAPHTATINQAIAAAGCGDTIMLVSAETHYGGDGNSGANNPIVLAYKGCSAANPITIETDRIASIPPGGTAPGATRLTADYADAATRLIPQIINIGTGNLISTQSGVQGCAKTLTMQSPLNAAVTAGTVLAADYNYGANGSTLQSTSTAPVEHSVSWSFTATGSAYQATVMFSPIPVDRLTANMDGAAVTTAAVASGAGIHNGDLIQLDEEAITVGAGGGTAALSGLTRGASGSAAQVAHPYCEPGEGGSPVCLGLVGPVFNLTSRIHQAFLRLGGYTCVVDTTGAGSVVSHTAGSTCTILDVGLFGTQSHWYQIQLTLPASTTVASQFLYFGLASGGATTYAGTTSDALYFYRPTIVDSAQADATYRCPAAGYVLRGLELTGGTAGSNWSLIALPDQNTISANHYVQSEFPHDIVFDQILFRENYISQPTRECLYDLGYNTSYLNSTFEGCTSATTQFDGGTTTFSPQGPMTFRNNSLTASSSGLGLGAIWSTRSFPGGDLDYYYSTTGCNPGCNGTLDIGYNFIYMPEFIRWQFWAPNQHVTPGAVWQIGNGGPFEIVAQTTGTTGAAEPSWDLTPGHIIADGTATWKVQTNISYGSTCHLLLSTTAYTAGEWIIDYSGTNLAVVTTGGTTDSSVTNFPGGLTPGQTYTNNGVVFKIVTQVWTANYAVLPYEFIANSTASNSWRFYNQAACATGATEPAWTYTEGATISDGTCTWHATLSGVYYQHTSKNLSDAKGLTNTHFHHNTFFNSWTQGNGGSGQGVAVEMRSFTGQGGPWSAVRNVVFENSIIDSAQAGINLLGIGGQDDPWLNAGYCLPPSTSWLCPLNTYVNGSGFTGFTLRNVKITNIGAAPNTITAGTNGHSSALAPVVAQTSGPITGLTVDHVFVDGLNATTGFFIAQSAWPVAAGAFTNSVARKGSSSWFACQTGSGFTAVPCGNQPFPNNTSDFPALNFAYYNSPLTAGAVGAGTYPNPNAAFSATNVFGGSIFAGATLASSLTCAHDSCSGELPANNRNDSWASLNLSQYGEIPVTDSAYNTALDGFDPGIDPQRLPLVMNPQVVSSDRAAIISFFCNLACRQSGINPTFQVSTQRDFELSLAPWIVPSLDPSLHGPDAEGNSISTFNYDGYLQNAGQYTAIVTGLSANTTYYYRINIGGAIYGIVNGSTPPPSFTTSSPKSGSGTITVAATLSPLTVGASGAANMVVEYGTSYSRSSDTILGGGTTGPVSCTVGGGACSALFSATAGAPVYFRYRIRNSGGSTVIAQPVQVGLP